MKKKYITGYIETAIGKIPQVSTIWSNQDKWSTIKIRWAIGRMDYMVEQGLYAVGTPDENSHVFISANFKLSFDHLRKSLQDMHAWILVLDTKGVNVWCAAGKGTFGTKELIHQIKTSEIDKIISHKKVIVPQLGATGVAAHEVKSITGFHVIYGPVLAKDINAFVLAGLKATPEMRKIKFHLKERLKLIPVEITYGKYYLLIIPALFFFLSGFNSHVYSVDMAWVNGSKSFVNLIAAYIAGCVITPIVLPWIPFKRFSLKGVMVGWGIALLLMYFHFIGNNVFEIISWFLIMGGISSFLAMNFTGSSTFTSLSGVQKEMKTALPVQITAASLGFIVWTITRFI